MYKVFTHQETALGGVRLAFGHVVPHRVPEPSPVDRSPAEHFHDYIYSIQANGVRTRAAMRSGSSSRNPSSPPSPTQAESATPRRRRLRQPGHSSSHDNPPPTFCSGSAEERCRMENEALAPLNLPNRGPNDRRPLGTVFKDHPSSQLSSAAPPPSPMDYSSPQVLVPSRTRIRVQPQTIRRLRVPWQPDLGTIFEKDTTSAPRLLVRGGYSGVCQNSIVV